MGKLIFAIFVLVPIIEILIFLIVGDIFGFWLTISSIILTAIIGAWAVKIQSFSVLKSLQQNLNQKNIPSDEIFHAGCLLIAGLLLITPGFFTDAIGFLLLFQGFRGYIKKILFSYFGKIGFVTQNHHDVSNTKIFEADYKDITTKKNDPNDNR